MHIRPHNAMPSVASSLRLGMINTVDSNGAFGRGTQSHSTVCVRCTAVFQLSLQESECSIIFLELAHPLAQLALFFLDLSFDGIDTRLGHALHSGE